MNTPAFVQVDILNYSNILIISTQGHDSLIDNIEKIFSAKACWKYKWYDKSYVSKNKVKYHIFEMNKAIWSRNADTLTFFCGNFKDTKIMKFYDRYIDNKLYQFDKIRDIFCNKKIVVADGDGKIFYYEIEKYDMYLDIYRKNRFSYNNVTKLISEIKNKNSLYHFEYGYLYSCLLPRLYFINKCHFIAMILTNESINLPIEMRCEVLYKMIQLEYVD